MNLRESKTKSPKWIYETTKQRMPNEFKRIQSKKSQMDS